MDNQNYDNDLWQIFVVVVQGMDASPFPPKHTPSL